MVTPLEIAILTLLVGICLKKPLGSVPAHTEWFRRRAVSPALPAPPAQSNFHPRSRSLIRDLERHTVEAQDTHPPVLQVDQKSKKSSASLLSTSPAHNIYSPDETIASAMSKSSPKEPSGIDPTLNATRVPIHADIPCNPQPMPPTSRSHDPQYGPGFFPNAQNIVMNNPVMIEATNEDFMRDFAQHTIQGAELDSSARDPPPRCHPGTRVKIVGRMRSRLRNPIKRVQWLVGPAGVGKSAIMQTIAELEQEDSAVFAALFFSAPNGRNDPSKVVATLAYQIALRHEGYYHHIRLKVNANPKLWEKSIDVQFTEFIIEPFVTMELYKCPNPVLVFIDGLDECNGRRDQIRILSLILDFTTKYPRAPLLWVVASRPEAHITAYLKPLTFYDKEEVSIDSTDACQDTERFLRAEFEKIRESDPFLESAYRQWPPESQFTKLLAAVLGLFAYAETAIRFIGDLGVGDPISRLQVILDLIDDPSGSLFGSQTQGSQPMAHLDALYRYILSRVGYDNVRHTEEILAFTIFSGNIRLRDNSLQFACDWMGMAANVMYGALRQLHSVIYVPLPCDAAQQRLRIYHKSFSDFLLDPQKSGLSLGTLEDEQCRRFLRSARVLGDIPYPIQPPVEDPRKHVLLSWSIDGAASVHSQQSRLYLTASDAFQAMSSLPDVPLPQIVHALKVLWWDVNVAAPVGQFVYGLLFNNTHPEASRLLRKDGALQDIPVSLLDLDVISECLPSIGRGNGTYDWTGNVENSYPVLFGELLLQLRHAQTQFPHDLVRVFIGTGLLGVVQFKTRLPFRQLIKRLATRRSLEPDAYTFLYDFSTIHGRLKK